VAQVVERLSSKHEAPGAWTQGLHLEPLHQPFFVEGFFRDRVSWIVCPGWLWTVILLISASWVARITGVSHWHLGHLEFLILTKDTFTIPPFKKKKFSFCVVFFGRNGVWTKSLTLATQALYHLGHPTSPKKMTLTDFDSRIRQHFIPLK
jgi:hypothetical protein